MSVVVPKDAQRTKTEAARALGTLLRRAREERGWSRTQVARAAHIDQSWLYKVETGKHWPSWHLAAHLAELLDVPQADVEALFARVNPPIAELRKELAGAEPLAAAELVRKLARRCDTLLAAAHAAEFGTHRGEPRQHHAHLALTRFEYLYQLVQRRPEELRTIKGFGRLSSRALEETLQPMGLSLDMKLDERMLIAVCQEILRNTETETRP